MTLEEAKKKIPEYRTAIKELELKRDRARIKERKFFYHILAVRLDERIKILESLE